MPRFLSAPQQSSLHGRQDFTASGTFTAKTDVVYVTGVGSGGGGGGSESTAPNPGGGGGSAEACYRKPIPTVIGQTYAITIPAGGAAGSGNNSPAPGAGGNGAATTFAGLLTLNGGGGGQPGSAGAPGAGGVAGSSSLSRAYKNWLTNFADLVETLYEFVLQGQAGSGPSGAASFFSTNGANGFGAGGKGGVGLTVPDPGQPGFLMVEW